MPDPDRAALDDEMLQAVASLRRAVEACLGIDLPVLSSLAALGQDADAETLKLIAGLVQEIMPRHVIEFGSGATTELLAQLGFDHGRMAVTTFEHDPWAAREVLQHANPFAINYRWFAFCLCPLVARRIAGTLVPVYDDGMTTATVPYPADLIVIHGPPRELGGRAGMLPQALTYARRGSIVLLLDARSEEEDAIGGWLNNLAAHLRFSPPGLLGRHLAFIVREPLAKPYRLDAPRAQEWGAPPVVLEALIQR